MRILQITKYFTAKKGGEFNICYNLSKTLVKMNHEVTILTTDIEYDHGAAEALQNVDVIPFHCVVDIAAFLYTPSMNKWLNKHLKDFDVIHIHGNRAYQSIIISKYALKYNIPYIIQPHGAFPRIVEKQHLKKIYDFFWGNNVLSSATKVIAVSNYERETLLASNISPYKISVIYNGLPVERYLASGEYDEEKRSSMPLFRSNEGSKKILFLGRLHKIKGIEFLIKTIGQLILHDKRNIFLIIAGPGTPEYIQSLVNLCDKVGIADQVLFTNHVEDTKHAYLSADVVVYPSKYEIFGLVPLEATLCGVPVIVTDGCGCGEIIREIDCGYLIHYGDCNGLEEQIRYVLDNPIEAQKKVKRGQEYIIKYLSWDYITSNFIEEYQYINQ